MFEKSVIQITSNLDSNMVAILVHSGIFLFSQIPSWLKEACPGFREFCIKLLGLRGVLCSACPSATHGRILAHVRHLGQTSLGKSTEYINHEGHGTPSKSNRTPHLMALRLLT